MIDKSGAKLTHSTLVLRALWGGGHASRRMRKPRIELQPNKILSAHNLSLTPQDATTPPFIWPRLQSLSLHGFNPQPHCRVAQYRIIASVVAFDPCGSEISIVRSGASIEFISKVACCT